MILNESPRSDRSPFCPYRNRCLPLVLRYTLRALANPNQITGAVAWRQCELKVTTSTLSESEARMSPMKSCAVPARKNTRKGGVAQSAEPPTLLVAVSVFVSNHKRNAPAILDERRYGLAQESISVAYSFLRRCGAVFKLTSECPILKRGPSHN